MNARTTSLVVLALAGLFAPAVAGNADPDSTTGYQTTFVRPSGHTYGGGSGAGVADDKTCVWDYLITPSIPDDRKHDPAWDYCGINGSYDAYAHAVADGMQVFAYAWAWDSCLGADSGAATSASSSGSVKVFARKVPAGCTARISVDWMPKMRLRVHQYNPPGNCHAAALMMGEVKELDFGIQLAGGLRADSAAVAAEASVAVSMQGLSGTLQIPLVLHTKSSPLEETHEDNRGAWAAVTEATAKYVGSTNIGAGAASSIDNWIAESEAWVWDSRAGLDLHGECAAPCRGYAYVVYGWPLPL